MAGVDPNWEVTVEDVKAMRDRGEDFLLLDVRRPEEFAAAHIDGAKLVTLDTLPNALPHLADWADKPVITHCHKGMRSLQAAAFLRQQGFENVKSMAGGIDAWSLRIDTNVPRY